jgi:hypothetical protein
MTTQRQAKAEAKRKAKALACAAKLDASIASVREFLNACRDCSDNSGDELRGISDSRNILIRDMAEYSAFLHGRFE